MDTEKQLDVLTDEEIRFWLSERDTWHLRDIVVFAFGYDHTKFDWQAAQKKNSFPGRPIDAAIEAINDGKLKYVAHIPTLDTWNPQCTIRKAPFIKWAQGHWSKEPAIQKTYKLWVNYKVKQGKAPASSEKTEAKVRQRAQELQFEGYKKHVEAGSAKPYKANRAEIARHLTKTSFPKLKEKSIYKYAVLLSQTELEQKLKVTISN